MLGSVGNRTVFPKGPTLEDEVDTEIHAPLGDIESQLIVLVKELTKPLFTVFDYTEFADSVYADIVNKFVDGKVT